MKLHIGGEMKEVGWKIYNIQEADYVDIVGDIRDLSQFEDESLEMIYASHVLEHVPQNEVTKTLQGIYRVLRKDGYFYCSVPNLEALAKLFLSEKLRLDQRWGVMEMIFGAQKDENDFHYVGWTLDFAKYFFGVSGFKTLKSVNSFNLFDDSSELKPFGIQISLNLIAKK